MAIEFEPGSDTSGSQTNVGEGFGQVSAMDKSPGAPNFGLIIRLNASLRPLKSGPPIRTTQKAQAKRMADGFPHLGIDKTGIARDEELRCRQVGELGAVMPCG